MKHAGRPLFGVALAPIMFSYHPWAPFEIFFFSVHLAVYLVQAHLK